MALTKTDFAKIAKVVGSLLDDKLKGFITRDEFLTYMDKILGELDTLRDEVTLSASKLSVEEINERVSKVEQQLAATV